MIQDSLKNMITNSIVSMIEDNPNPPEIDGLRITADNFDRITADNFDRVIAGV